jgi:hypothetical protein
VAKPLCAFLCPRDNEKIKLWIGTTTGKPLAVIKVVGRLLETELHELSRITQAKIADIEAKMKIWMR